MIEDLLIWKFVAEHLHCTRANSNPAFSTVIVCSIALVGPSPRISTQAELHCGDALDEQLETVSAQLAPGAFQIDRDQFAS
jgi:hypothetical protein